MYVTLCENYILPYFTSGVDRPLHLPSAEAGPMRVPECNQKVTGNGHKAVNSCEAVNRRL